MLALGSYPAVSLIEARAERDAAKALLRAGRDPSLDRRMLRAMAAGDRQRSLKTVAMEWHATKQDNWSPHYAGQVLRSLQRDAFPALGHFPITELTGPVILAAMREIEKRGAIEQAHRVRQRISDVFVFAMGAGLVTANPAAVIAPALRPVIRGKQPALTDLGELLAMLKKVEAEEAYPLTRLALRLLLLTALRPGEIAGARWDELTDLDGAVPLWRVQADRMKMKRERWVPLSLLRRVAEAERDERSGPVRSSIWEPPGGGQGRRIGGPSSG